ncbi:MAG: hypothetical protein NC122_09510 [Faecalibacterium sp.]|nr:hypothetical protein [Faecalibacterium sp.]
MVISAESSLEPLPEDDYSIYFAEGMNKGNGQTSKIMCSNIELKIICMINELQKVIDNCISAFFLCHNFGTRQDKGFGSFVIVKENSTFNDAAVVSALSKKYQSDTIYCIKNISKPFVVIKYFYSLLKSGYNPNYAKVDYKGNLITESKNGGYEKSLLFKYFMKKDIGSEKKYLKEMNVAPAIENKNSDHRKYDEYYFIRALLGVPGSYSFISDDPKLFKKNSNGGWTPGREEITVSRIIKSDKMVDDKKADPYFRFPSPIFFKVVKHGKNYSIFFTGTELNLRICNQTFRFKNKGQKNKEDKKWYMAENRNDKSIEIVTPDESKVDKQFVFDFLKYAVDELNANFSIPGRYIERNRKDDLECKIIEFEVKCNE